MFALSRAMATATVECSVFPVVACLHTSKTAAGDGPRNWGGKYDVWICVRARDSLPRATPCAFFILSRVVLKPMVKKQLSAWRPIKSRLTLLKQLVSEFGLESGSDLTIDGIMGFVQVGQDDCSLRLFS